MNELGCCRPHSLRSGFTIGKWVAPSAILLLIPKCPLCIIGYVAAFTGLGLSFSAAQYLRSTLIAASLAGAAYLIVRAILAMRSRADPPL